MAKRPIIDLSSKMNQPSTTRSGQSSSVIRFYTWKDVLIHPELEEFLPKRPQEEFQEFLKKVEADGVIREPLDVWEVDGKRYLADGHNRREVAKATNLEFKIIPHHWKTIEEVKVWMASKQSVERRNLTPWQTSYYRGWAYSNTKKDWGGDRASSQNENLTQKADSQIDSVYSSDKEELKAQPGKGVLRASSQNDNLAKTSDVLGDQYGVNASTIMRDYDFYLGVQSVIEINHELGIQLRDGYNIQLTKQVVSVFGKLEKKPSKLSSIEDIKGAISATKPKPVKRTGSEHIKKLPQILKRVFAKQTEKNISETERYLEELLEVVRGFRK